MAPPPDAALLLDQILAGIGQPFHALDGLVRQAIAARRPVEGAMHSPWDN